MKTLKTLLASTFALTLVATSLSAADYFYDMGRTSNSDWLGTDAWSTSGFGGPFDADWIDGNMANFDLNGNYAVNIGGDGSTVDVGAEGIISTGTGLLTISSGGGGGVLIFDGGNFQISDEARITPGAAVTGDFTLEGVLNYDSTIGAGNNTQVYEGTVTVSGNGSSFQTATDNASSFSTASNVILENGGEFLLAAINDDVSMGSLQFDSSGGTFSIDPGESGSGPTNVTVTSLSGSGGSDSQIVLSNTSGSNQVRSLTINQSIDTSFSGQIFLNSPTGGHRARLAKTGNGALALSNIVQAFAGTTISGGTLILNGSGSKDFRNRLPGESTAITVQSGGTLASNTTLSIGDTTTGNDVVIENGGSLAPGEGGDSIGMMEFEFRNTTPGTLDLTEGALGTEWLVFDLGADATAGTTYDQILFLTGGTLAIGNGLLEFEDFSFTSLAGFGEGTYTLFDLGLDGVLSGSLGSSLSGNIGGFTGTIALDGNDIILNVVPEPATAVLLLAGGLVLLLFRRRRI